MPISRNQNAFESHLQETKLRSNVTQNKPKVFERHPKQNEDVFEQRPWLRDRVRLFDLTLNFTITFSTLRPYTPYMTTLGFMATHSVALLNARGKNGGMSIIWKMTTWMKEEYSKTKDWCLKLRYVRTMDWYASFLSRVIKNWYFKTSN